MAKRRLTKDEYAEATGLSAGGAERLYQDLRNWRRAKTREDLRKGLYLTESAFAAASPRHSPRPYQRDYQSPAEVQAMQASLLKEISAITEGRRKDAEAYRKALLEAAVRVQGKRSDASVARMRIQGDLVKKAHDDLSDQYKVLRRGGSSGSGLYIGEDGSLKVTPQTESGAKEIESSLASLENLRTDFERSGTDRPGAIFATGNEKIADEVFKSWRAGAQGGKNRDVSYFKHAAESLYGGTYDSEKAQDRLLDDLASYALGNVSDPTEMDRIRDLSNDEILAIAAKSNRRHDMKALLDLTAKLNAGEGPEGGSGSGSGGSYLHTIPGLTDAEYPARLAQIDEVMRTIGAGGGPLEPIMAELLGAGDLSMEQLQGSEEKLKVTVTQPMSQGEGESGRTPTGEGALPPGTSGMATGQRERDVVSPGEQFANKVADVQDPDAALNRTWEMYNNLDNARTSAMDVHLLGQIQKSAPWLQMKQKLGIEDDRKALKAAMMMTRQRRRDANIRDSSRLREIRKETKRSRLLGGLSRLDKSKDKAPRPASAGAMLTGGADGCPGDE